MGNAPLPKPPVPTSIRAVIPITTRKKSAWDTELQLLSPALLLTTANSFNQAQIDNQTGQVSADSDNGINIDEEFVMHDGIIELTEIPSTAPPNVINQGNDDSTDHNAFPYPSQLLKRNRATTRNDDDDPSTATTVDSSGNSACQDHNQLQQQPSPLRQRNHYYSVVPPAEYQERLQALQSRLKEWKGGKINTFVGVISILIVLVFSSLWLFHPTFWMSPFVRNGFAGLLLVIILIIFYGCMYRWSKQETARLFVDVDDMFRSWRRSYYVSVKVKRVSHLRLIGQNGKSDTRTTHCYCLEMNLVDVSQSLATDGQDGRSEVNRQVVVSTRGITGAVDGVHNSGNDDAASLGTFYTNGSDELEDP